MVPEGEGRVTGPAAARSATYPVGAAITVAELERDPHPAHARLLAAEPVSWLPAIGGWLVTGREVALVAMRDAERFTVDDPRFSTARVVGPSMLSLDGADQARHRAPFARPFRLAPVRERFGELLDGEVRALVASIRPAGTGELRRAIAGTLAVRSMQIALGLVETPVAEVLGWYDAIVATVSAAVGDEPLDPAGPIAYRALAGALQGAIVREPRTSLLAEAAAGRLTETEAASNAAVLLFGGIETTEGMIANLLVHVLGDTKVARRLRGDRSLVPAAIEESLRLEPAAAVIDRYATTATELGGARIARGDLVRISLAGANRDPAVFEDPDRFVLDRPNVRLHVSFAHGPHVCLGMHLARLEARLALEALLDGLPGLELDPERTTPARGLVFRKPASVWGRWG